MTFKNPFSTIQIKPKVKSEISTDINKLKKETILNLEHSKAPMKISKAVTPAEEKAEAANKASKLQRAKVHGDYTYFKATHGQDVVALRSAIVDESQKTWLAESKDASCMQANRAKG